MNEGTLQDTSRQQTTRCANVKVHYWDREDFDRQVGPCSRGSIPVPGYGVANFHYPKSTLQAMLELRVRGLDASISGLQALLGDGYNTPTPKSCSKDPLDVVWEKEHIDAVAAWFDELEFWLPQTHLCVSCNLHYGQFARAFLKGLVFFGWNQKAWMEFDVSCLLMVVQPAKTQYGYGRVIFLPKETELVVEMPVA